MSYTKNNLFIGFTVIGKSFAVTLGGLDSDITVGDKFSVLSPLNLIEMDWYEKDWYCVYYYDVMVSFEVKDSIITCIDYCFPD